MSLDSRTIEILSVNAVRDSIAVTGVLDPIINENDKEPSWDGNVNVYKNKTKKKNDIIGKMPVQVKGKECDDHSKDDISYSMSVADLNNYRFNGCVLFVVYIGDNGSSKKIYYNDLTPIKLRNVLNKSKGQKSATVRLRLFPSDNYKKVSIFVNCYNHCKMQASFSNGKLYSIDELQKMGELEEIFAPLYLAGNTNFKTALVNNQIYLYAKIKGSAIPQPLDIVPQNLCIKEVKNALISIEDRVFYTNVSIESSEKTTSFCCGNSFRMEFQNRDNSCKVHYQNSSKVRVMAKDLDFILSFIEKGYFMVDDIRMPFDYNNADFSGFDFDQAKEWLAYAKEIVSLLDTLNCEEDIDIQEMSDRDLINLNRLYTAIIEKKPITGLKEKLPAVICVDIGKLKFAVCVKPCEEKGTYEMTDFFNTRLYIGFEDPNNDGTMLPVSQFAILNNQDLLTLSNINFDVLLSSFQNIEHHHETYNRANGFLLSLLCAYDKAEGARKEKLLKVCDDFSRWILEASDDEMEYNIKILNRLQTVKRVRELNMEETKMLGAIVENSEVSEEYKVGAYLLLGQQQLAEIHFSELSEELQKDFKEYPIYHFWKN